MTNERAQAYGRVIHTLEQVAAAKLHPHETQLIRDTADTLLFATTTSDGTDHLNQILTLVETLTESGRWTEPAVNTLVEDLLACGPSRQPATAA